MMGGPRRHAAVSSAKKSPQMADVVEVVRCKSVLQITEGAWVSENLFIY